MGVHEGDGAGLLDRARAQAPVTAPALALVDRIRALPRERRLALYRAMPPGGLASLRYTFAFWARPEQALPPVDEQWTIDVSEGERGSGKSWRAMQLFLREVESGRAKLPRIIGATDAILEATVVKGPSGLLRWLPPHRRPRWVSSKGFAGLLVFPNGAEVVCCSAQAPGQAIGIGCDLTWADDPAGWVVSCGEPTAERTWIEMSKSNREGLGRIIVATTAEGATFIERLLAPGEVSNVRYARLGAVESNAGNLSAAYIRFTVADLKKRGEWDTKGSGPYADIDFNKAPIRIHEVGELTEIAVGVDPSEGNTPRHDLWGIVIGGRRPDRHVVILEDASGAHDDTSAGRAVFDAIDRWSALHPGVPVRIVGEANRGGERLKSALRAAHLEREVERLRLDPTAPARPMPEVVLVTTRDGKAKRAGPVVALMKSGLMHHLAGLTELEKQARGWNPDAPPRPRQDDRIDGELLVAHHLGGLGVESSGPWRPTSPVQPVAVADVPDPYRYQPMDDAPDPYRY